MPAQVLMSIIETMPASLEELRNVKGMGPAKVIQGGQGSRRWAQGDGLVEGDK